MGFWGPVSGGRSWPSEEGCRTCASPKPSVTCFLFSGFRQLALKALNERLKRVEDQSVWPSMDDDEEEAGAKKDSPLPSEKASTPPGKGTAPESSLITFEAAPPKL